MMICRSHDKELKSVDSGKKQHIFKSIFPVLNSCLQDR